MPTGLAALFWGIITFSLLIVIHEGGHFLSARLFGVKVHEFMVGLPGPAIRFRGRKTTYGVTAIPLGGYVRIAGMEPGPEEPLLGPILAFVTRLGQATPIDVATEFGIEETEADRLLLILADWDAIYQAEGDEYLFVSKHEPHTAEDEAALLDTARSRTYRGLPFGKRIVVLSMGVLFNLITAMLVFTVVLSAFGYYKDTMIVDQVAKGSGAAAAGIKVGDTVTALNGVKIKVWTDLVAKLHTLKAGDTVVVTVVRDGQTQQIEAVLGARPDSDLPLLGLTPKFAFTRPNVAEAFGQSAGFVWLTLKAIVGFFNPATFKTSISQSSSVIGASYMAAEAAESSRIDYAYLIAALSLSLGVINIFPIPPLDGGKVAVEVFERLRGRPLSRKFNLGLSAVGAALLFTLIAVLMYSDVVRYILP